jgi:hypothetical protein
MPAALTLAMCMDLSLLASLSRLPCLVMRFQSLETVSVPLPRVGVSRPVCG